MNPIRQIAFVVLFFFINVKFSLAQIDQSQVDIDYGFSIGSEFRWQEFKPQLDQLAEFRIFIQKDGLPTGEFTLKITEGTAVLFENIFDISDINSSDWFVVSLSQSIITTPGNLYRIEFNANYTFTNVDNQIAWRGGQFSNYPEICDVNPDWPTYDYAFITYGPCNSINGGTTIEVTNTNDSGPGSLRNAIECANADPVLDNINIFASGTLYLNYQLPIVVDQGINITNFGSMIIDGGNNIGNGIILEGDELTLNSLSFKNFIYVGCSIYGSNNLLLGCNYSNMNYGIDLINGEHQIQNCTISMCIGGIREQSNSMNSIISFCEIFDCTDGIQII
ncbi:MAG: hypothetical protein R2766_10190 [Saprospiraceae bacterium]